MFGTVESASHRQKPGWTITAVFVIVTFSLALHPVLDATCAFGPSVRLCEAGSFSTPFAGTPACGAIHGGFVLPGLTQISAPVALIIEVIAPSALLSHHRLSPPTQPPKA